MKKLIALSLVALGFTAGNCSAAMIMDKKLAFHTPPNKALAQKIVVYGGSPPFTFAVFVKPEHGTLDLKTDGNFVYTPAKDFKGFDKFEFTVIDQDKVPVGKNVYLQIGHKQKK